MIAIGHMPIREELYKYMYVRVFVFNCPALITHYLY